MRIYESVVQGHHVRLLGVSAHKAPAVAWFVWEYLKKEGLGRQFVADLVRTFAARPDVFGETPGARYQNIQRAIGYGAEIDGDLLLLLIEPQERVYQKSKTVVLRRGRLEDVVPPPVATPAWIGAVESIRAEPRFSTLATNIGAESMAPRERAPALRDTPPPLGPSGAQGVSPEDWHDYTRALYHLEHNEVWGVMALLERIDILTKRVEAVETELPVFGPREPA